MAASADQYVDYTDFPMNAVFAIATGAKTLTGMTEGSVFMRPLRATDPGACIGVVPVDWRPLEYEIGQAPDSQPEGITVYNLAIQALIKHTDEVLGLAAHAKLSKLVRGMVDNRTATSLSLAQLSVTDGTTKERVLKIRVTRQQFLANEINNSFLYISSLAVALHVETVEV